MIVVLIIRIVLIALTIYLSFFSLWRSFEREHVEDVPMALDKVIIASLIAWYLARIPSGIEMILSHTIAPLAILNPLEAVSSWQVGIILFCIAFYVLMGDHWRDRYALLDFAVVTIPVFLAGYMLWQTFSLVITCILTNTAIPVGYIVTLIVGMIAMIGLSRLLAYFERQYRAYFWYRYRRSSAQTGFVTSAFLIGVGFLGMLFSLHQIPFGLLTITTFLTVFSLFTFVGGFILLYIRSGRLKKK